MKIRLDGGPLDGKTFVPVGTPALELVMLEEDAGLNELMAEITGVDEGLRTCTYRQAGVLVGTDVLVYAFVEGGNGESARYDE